MIFYSEPYCVDLYTKDKKSTNTTTNKSTYATDTTAPFTANTEVFTNNKESSNKNKQSSEQENTTISPKGKKNYN